MYNSYIMNTTHTFLKVTNPDVVKSGHFYIFVDVTGYKTAPIRIAIYRKSLWMITTNVEWAVTVTKNFIERDYDAEPNDVRAEENFVAAFADAQQYAKTLESMFGAFEHAYIMARHDELIAKQEREARAAADPAMDITVINAYLTLLQDGAIKEIRLTARGSDDCIGIVSAYRDINGYVKYVLNNDRSNRINIINLMKTASGRTKPTMKELV